MTRYSGILGTFIVVLVVGCVNELNDVTGVAASSNNSLGSSAPVPQSAEAMVAEIEDLIPGSGTWDRDALLDLYEWLDERFGVTNEAETVDNEFSPEELVEIACLAPGLPLAQRWSIMRDEMERRHPGKIAHDIHWTFNAAGNVVCQIAMVYASPTEYDAGQRGCVT